MAEIHPDDILLGLLVLGKEDHKEFTGFTRKIHNSLRELQQEYPDVLMPFKFTTVTPFPYSEQLASSLENLKWARLIGMENPDFRKYLLKPGATTAFNATATEESLSAEIITKLTAASKKFWNNLCSTDDLPN